ncbi:MAG TPA: PEP-CTERM sorting domain-containing protein [Bryobacteraceae bacterium]|nr:PEP-CTERM sorting domain-containing protein [Bryobacteraceae bacterium]
MKKLLLFVFLGTMVAVVPSMASPVNCNPSGTYADLIALGSTGCLINGLLFDNFAFTPSATGTGTLPTAVQMGYTLDNPGISSGTGELIYGFEFNPNLSVSGVGSEDIDIAYSIIAPSAEITSIHLLETAVTSGGATATVAEGPDRACFGVNTGCSFLPTIQSIPSAPHQDLLGIGPYTEIDVFKDINVSSNNANGLAQISNVRDSVDLNYGPEPATFGLLGGALIGLSMMARRKKKA